MGSEASGQELRAAGIEGDYGRGGRVSLGKLEGPGFADRPGGASRRAPSSGPPPTRVPARPRARRCRNELIKPAVDWRKAGVKVGIRGRPGAARRSWSHGRLAPRRLGAAR
jgi:hypothetical protein